MLDKGTLALELLRETKRSPGHKTLQDAHEKRKIACVKKHIQAAGIDDRVVTGQAPDGWKLEDVAGYQRGSGL